jgi:hypothetical protein
MAKNHAHLDHMANYGAHPPTRPHALAAMRTEVVPGHRVGVAK